MPIVQFFKRNSFLAVFIIALFIYGVSAGTQITKQSKTPQYVYLANAFLHGRTYLDPLPPSTFDLISFHNKWYVPGGITPAILLMPFVAIFGIGISDVLYGVILGAINVVLMYLFLGDVAKSKKIQIWLTALFGLGTVHWWVSSVGSVWFNAHLVAVLFMLLFMRATIKDQNWQAGLYFSLAVLARPPIIFSILFYVLYSYFKENDLQKTVRRITPFVVVLTGGVALMLAYNYLRFESPFDFGYGYVKGTESLTSAYAAGGGFSISYMPCNIYVSLFGTPNIPSNPLPDINQTCSHLHAVMSTFGKISTLFNPIGMSIFLTTPAFLLVFRANIKDGIIRAGWAGILGTLVILWMYHTTGWVQFGYRYILDVSVFVFLLLGSSMEEIGWGNKLLFLASFIMGAIGVYLMYYMTFGLIWNEMAIKLLKTIYWIIF
jgi:hypothetical protein